MKVLIANVYSYKNKGDAAIVVSLVNEIRRVFPEPSILIQTADIQHDTNKYGTPITGSLLWYLLSSVRESNPLTRVLVPSLGILGIVWYLLLYKLKVVKKPYGRLLSKNIRTFMKENHETDMVIACGGGYLRTANGSVHDSILLFVTCLNFMAAKYMGKSVYLYSQSIGPVHGRLQEAMLNFSLNRVDLIEPREDVSMKYLRQHKISAPIVATADPALLLGDFATFNEASATLEPGRLHVGVTVRKWFKTRAELYAYETAVAANIDYLIREHNAQVFYIPQVIAENFGDDDRIIAHEVWEKVENKKDFTVIDKDLHPFEIIGLCGKMDIFIGTRMHSNIFSLISHVPVVAIEYEHKTRGIMRGLNLEELTIDIREVTPETLREKIDLLLQNRVRFKQELVKNLPLQIAEGKKAIEAIKEMHAQAPQKS